MKLIDDTTIYLGSSLTCDEHGSPCCYALVVGSTIIGLCEECAMDLLFELQHKMEKESAQ